MTEVPNGASWLGEIWMIVDPERRREMGRERVRRLRERRRDGAAVANVTVSRDMIDYLVAAGILGAWDDENPIEIAHAIEALLNEIAQDPDPA
jgi:hypothetical protein